MQNDKLLPCPFCGGELEFNKIFTLAICNECGAYIGFPKFRADERRIIKAINTRKPMERIVQQLEEKSNNIPIQYENNYEQGYTNGIDYAVDVVKKGGVDNATN